MSSLLFDPSSLSSPVGGGFQAVQSDRRGGGGGGRYAAALTPTVRRATVLVARSRSTCGNPRQHDVLPASPHSCRDVTSSLAFDFADGLGARAAPDDRQDGGQGSVIVGDVDFIRTVYITSNSERQSTTLITILQKSYRHLT